MKKTTFACGPTVGDREDGAPVDYAQYGAEVRDQLAATDIMLALVHSSNGFTVPQMRTPAVNTYSRTAGVSMAMTRVVVTGMGIVSCIGATLDDVKDSLYNCKSGITYCEEFEEVTMKSRVSGQPNFDWCAPSHSSRVSLIVFGVGLPRSKTSAR